MWTSMWCAAAAVTPACALPDDAPHLHGDPPPGWDPPTGLGTPIGACGL